MGLFRKKKEDEEIEEVEEEEVSPKEQPADIQMAKLAAKVDGLVDIRKSFSERFTLMSEQIGELRGMILDASKQIQTIEVDSTRTIELVKEVQPEKFMTLLRKQESQLEALKASVEGKDAIMKDIIADLSKIRKQMSFYRGIEQVQKLNDEIKKDLFSIKKVQAIVEQHSDKVESMFIDLQKRYGDMEGLTKSMREVEQSISGLKKQADRNSFEIEKKSRKADLEELHKKVEVFATTTNVENLKRFAEQLDSMMKGAQESLKDIESTKQKVQEVSSIVFQTNLPELALNVRKIDQKASLMEVDVNRNKGILETMNQSRDNLKRLGEIIQESDKNRDTINTLEQGMGGIVSRMVQLEKEKASGEQLQSIEQANKKQQESFRKMQQDMEHLTKTMDLIEKRAEFIKDMEKSAKQKDEAVKTLLVHQEETNQRIKELESHIMNLKGPTARRTSGVLRLADGTTIESMSELMQRLRDMPEQTFRQHVNSSRNDFADWIHSIGQKALAKVLRTKTSRRDFIAVLRVYSRMRH